MIFAQPLKKFSALSSQDFSDHLHYDLHILPSRVYNVFISIVLSSILRSSKRIFVCSDQDLV